MSKPKAIVLKCFIVPPLLMERISFLNYHISKENYSTFFDLQLKLPAYSILMLGSFSIDFINPNNAVRGDKPAELSQSRHLL
jgi:hypothetical protein